jgi:hypothetical protein
VTLLAGRTDAAEAFSSFSNQLEQLSGSRSFGFLYHGTRLKCPMATSPKSSPFLSISLETLSFRHPALLPHRAGGPALQVVRKSAPAQRLPGDLCLRQALFATKRAREQQQQR